MTDRAISLAALTVLEVPPIEAVEIARRCGYSHVGLRPVAATETEPHWPILTDPMLRRDLMLAIDVSEIGVLDIEIVRLVPEMDWSALEAVCAFAAEFGASRMLVADNDPDPSRSRDNLAHLAELGIQFAVEPHLEFMPWTCAANFVAARERIGGIANCRLLIDAFHLVRSGGRVEDIAPREPSVGYLQLCDIDGPIPAMDEILQEARSNRLFPGDGEIDLAELLRRLPGIPISLEVPADRLRDAGVSAEQRARIAIERTWALLQLAD